MKKTFLVVYEKGRKNYGGSAPDGPGYGSFGGSFEEIRANLLEALQLYVDTAVDPFYLVPEPTSNSVTLPLEGETNARIPCVVERLTVNIPRARPSRRKLLKVKPLAAKRRARQAA